MTQEIKTVIDSFTGAYRFLSNFWPCEIMMDGVWYTSVEAAYQASKTISPIEREFIRLCESPGEAKKLGKRITIREDWDKIKLAVMEQLLYEKFQQPHLKQLLFDTGNMELIEGNTWGDTFWGVCNGEGQNHLGKLLMGVRNTLLTEQTINSFKRVVDSETLQPKLSA